MLYENDPFQREKLIFTQEAVEGLKEKTVALFGLGGVGSYVAEALARSGVGRLFLVDKDIIDITNINRQLYALHSTLGCDKVSVAKKRISDINPHCRVEAHKLFYLNNEETPIEFKEFDYVIDAVDNVTAKKEIILSSKKAGVPVISCMGTGNRTDPTALTVSDIYKTTGCPLARIMRKICRDEGIDSLKVVYSKEIPQKPHVPLQGERTIGSTAFVPPVAGMILASEVIKDLIFSLDGNR